MARTHPARGVTLATRPVARRPAPRADFGVALKPTVAESNIDLLLGLERIGILGPSAMGCMSLELAWRYPETTTCVICIGAPPRMAGHIEEMARYWDDSGFDCALMYEEHDRFDRELFAGMERNQIG